MSVATGARPHHTEDSRQVGRPFEGSWACKPRSHPSIRCTEFSADLLLRNPITGVRRCAFATSGHEAAAPPISATNFPSPHAASQVPLPIISVGTAGRRRFDPSGAYRRRSAGPWGGAETF